MLKKVLKKIPGVKKAFYILIILKNYFEQDILKIKKNQEAIAKFISKFEPIGTNLELIRIGTLSDGGYLVPNDLENISLLISPGVGGNSDFELYFAKKDIKCVLIDGSVDSPPIENENFIFIKKFLKSKVNNDSVSLSNVLQEFNDKTNNVILQMDIEGSEYEVLADASQETLSQFRIMIIEFHNFGQIFINNDTNKIESIFNKILSNFYIVHIHPNNCASKIKVNNMAFADAIEVTFLRKDRVNTLYSKKYSTNKLDRKNCITSPNIKIRF